MWSQTAGIHSIKPSLKIDSRPAPRPAARRHPAWSTALGRSKSSPTSPPASKGARSCPWNWYRLQVQQHPMGSLRGDVAPRGALLPAGWEHCPESCSATASHHPCKKLCSGCNVELVRYPKIPLACWGIMAVSGRVRDT